MLQKLGKIKVRTLIFSLRDYMQVNALYYLDQSPHYLVEFVMAVHMILSLPKLIP